MLRKPSLFEKLHEPGPLLREAARSPLVKPQSPVCGVRGVYRPTMGLQTMQKMGPVRHALAQRVVSGVIEVHAPWADAVARGEESP